MVKIPAENTDMVPHLDLPAFQYLSKNALFGHDTVAGLIKDGTAGMADFPYLRHFQEGMLADFESGAYGKTQKIDPLGGDIFSEIPWSYFQPQIHHLLDGLHSQETDLPVSRTGMGIVLQTQTRKKAGSAHILFSRSLFRTDVDSEDLCGRVQL
jgi:hypothetical protein